MGSRTSSDYLKLMASRVSIAKLERVQSDPWPEQMSPKMKLVDFSFAVSEPDRFKLDVLKFLQTTRFGYFRVEALAAKVPIPFLYRAIVDDIVAQCDLAAIIATDLFHSSDLNSIHFH